MLRGPPQAVDTDSVRQASVHDAVVTMEAAATCGHPEPPSRSRSADTGSTRRPAGSHRIVPTRSAPATRYDCAFYSQPNPGQKPKYAAGSKQPCPRPGSPARTASPHAGSCAANNPACCATTRHSTPRGVHPELKTRSSKPAGGAVERLVRCHLMPPIPGRRIYRRVPGQEAPHHGARPDTRQPAAVYSSQSGEYHDFDDGLSAAEIVNYSLLVNFRSLRLDIRVTGVIQRRPTSMKRPTGARPTAPAH